MKDKTNDVSPVSQRQISVSMDADIIRASREAAARQGRSLSNFVAWVLRQYLDGAGMADIRRDGEYRRNH